MPDSLFSLKDVILVVVGFLLGGYASFIASRIVLFHQLKHDVFLKVELMSALINGDSFDFRSGHRVDRLLETKAIEFHFYGHDAAYRLCHKIANELQAALDRVSGLRAPHNFDISTQKSQWLRQVVGLKSRKLAFFMPRRTGESVLDFYLSKEADYIRQAKSDITRSGGRIEELK